MRQFALWGLISVFSLSIVFHILVMAAVVPATIVWGGNATDHKELMRLETISIVINAFFLVFVLMLKGSFKIRLKPIIAKIILWFMTLVFALNTVGNILAKSSMETMIFTPITLLLSVLSLYLALNFNKAFPKK